MVVTKKARNKSILKAVFTKVLIVLDLQDLFGLLNPLSWPARPISSFMSYFEVLIILQYVLVCSELWSHSKN